MYERIKHLFSAYIELAYRHPWRLTFFWVTLSLGLLWVGSHLQVRGDLDDLFPEDTPAVIRAKETREILGNTQELRILIGSKNPEVHRAIAASIAAFLEAQEDMIERVEWERDTSFFEKNGLLFLPIKDLLDLEERVSLAIQKEVKKDLGFDDFGFDDEEDEKEGDGEDLRLPSLSELQEKHHIQELNRYFESPEKDVIGVKAYPNFRPGDATKTGLLNQRIEGELNKLIAAYPEENISYVMDGDYSQVSKAAEKILEDASQSGTWSMLGIILVVLLFFRKFRSLIFVAMVLGMATMWILGFIQLTIGYLNLVTSIIFAILLGLGVDYLIHGMSRVEEEQEKGLSFKEALKNGLLNLGRPAFVAMSTTAVTFFALIFFDFRGFSQLGFVAGAGIILAVLAFFLIYPPLAFGFHKIRPEKSTAKKNIATEGKTKGKGHPKPKAIALFAVLSLLVAIAFNSALHTRFDSDMGRFRIQDSETESALKASYKKAESQGASPALVVTKDLEETKRVHRYFEGVLKDMENGKESPYPRLTSLTSIWSFVPEKQDDKLKIIKEIKRKIDNKYEALEGDAKEDATRLLSYLEPQSFGPDGLPEWIKAKFTDNEGKFGRYVLLYTSGSKANALVALEVEEQLGDIHIPGDGNEPPLELYSAATFYISGQAYAVVKTEGAEAALLGFLAVLFLVILTTRQLKSVLRIMLPIIASFVLTLGLLAWLEIPLDLFNVVVLPQIFGIGIDTGIHLNHRLREGGLQVFQGLLASGKAAFISALLTVVGFGALLPIENEGLRSIGLVACIGVSTAFIITFLFFLAFYFWQEAKAKAALPSQRS